MDTIIKRKILLEDSIDRNYNSSTWGEITASTFYLNVFLTQTIDDMGLYTDMDFIELGQGVADYSVLNDKLGVSGITFPYMSSPTPYPTNNLSEIENLTLRLPSKTESDYYNFGNLRITGETDSKIDDVKSYDGLNRYKIGFNMESETYNNYEDIVVDGVSRVVSISEPQVYVFDTPDDSNIGKNSQIYGLLYNDYTGITRNVLINGQNSIIPLTTFRYIGEGKNETNISLSANTKEEYLFGIITTPKVNNDIYIDRGVTSVMDMHLRMSEIKSLYQLTRYGNGFYNITKQ